VTHHGAAQALLGGLRDRQVLRRRQHHWIASSTARQSGSVRRAATTWNPALSESGSSRRPCEMLHDAGDDSHKGPFRGRLARAGLDRLFTSRASAAAFAELLAGMA
jgi:p-hydroxybenzoate 3-monooxygenase